MNITEFKAGVRSAVALYDELQLLNIALSFESLEATPEFREVTRRPNTPYVEVYKSGLTQRAYNFILNDFSYLQFTFHSHRRPFGVRYAFYPNPYENKDLRSALVDAQEMGRDGEGYEWYLMELEEGSELHLVPPIRYEVAFEDYRELVHPTSHIHFGMHDDNRWPVERSMTPVAFALLVAKHYYGQAWRLGDREPGDPDYPNRFDNRFTRAKVESRLLDAHSFTTAERQQFYVG